MEPFNPKKKTRRPLPRAIIIPEGRQPFASQCFQNSSIWCRLKKSPLAKTGTCRKNEDLSVKTRMEVEWVGYCWGWNWLDWLGGYIHIERGVGRKSIHLEAFTISRYTLRKAHDLSIGFSHFFSKCFKVKIKKINKITKDAQIRYIWYDIYIFLPRKFQLQNKHVLYVIFFQTSISFYWFKVNIYSTQCILCHPSNRNEWNPKRDHLHLFRFNRKGLFSNHFCWGDIRLFSGEYHLFSGVDLQIKNASLWTTQQCLQNHPVQRRSPVQHPISVKFHPSVLVQQDVLLLNAYAP